MMNIPPPLPPSQPLFSNEVQVKQEPQKTEYIVRPGDNLTIIAKAYSVDLSRLWAANTQLTNPDLIEVDKPLNIPQTGDVLPDRPMPVSIQVPALNIPHSSGVGLSNSGNTYYWGQCVWFVKNELSWVKNGWGNASDWKYTSGHPISSVPIIGAIAWTKAYGHVGIVRAINGDGTIVTQEMNYKGLGVVDSRTAPVGEFEYIYP